MADNELVLPTFQVLCPKWSNCFVGENLFVVLLSLFSTTVFCKTSREMLGNENLSCYKNRRLIILRYGPQNDRPCWEIHGFVEKRREETNQRNFHSGKSFDRELVSARRCSILRSKIRSMCLLDGKVGRRPTFLHATQISPKLTHWFASSSSSCTVNEFR